MLHQSTYNKQALFLSKIIYWVSFTKNKSISGSAFFKVQYAGPKSSSDIPEI